MRDRGFPLLLLQVRVGRNSLFIWQLWSNIFQLDFFPYKGTKKHAYPLLNVIVIKAVGIRLVWFGKKLFINLFENKLVIQNVVSGNATLTS